MMIAHPEPLRKVCLAITAVARTAAEAVWAASHATPIIAPGLPFALREAGRRRFLASPMEGGQSWPQPPFRRPEPADPPPDSQTLMQALASMPPSHTRCEPVT